MKKITAIALALLMVLSMIPAMALMSSAATEFTSGTYGSGAETWRQTAKDASDKDVYYHHTQFLYYVPTNIWSTVKEAVGFTGTAYNKDTGAWVTGGITGGRFVLHVTDSDGKKTDVECAPTTVGSIGENAILRFETADYGTPKLQIENGNTYKISLDIYLPGSSSADYTGSEVSTTWTAGKADEGNDKMYVGGTALSTIPTYTPKVDPYANPVNTTFYHSGFTSETSDFEAHDTFGKNLLLGFPMADIPEGGNTGANTIKGSKAILTIGGKKYESTIASEIGADAFPGFNAPGGKEEDKAGVNCYCFRIGFEEFPAAGTYENSTIEIRRTSDNKLMYTGKMTIVSSGDAAAGPADMTKYPVNSALTAYTGKNEETGEKKSDWEVYHGNLVLLVVLDKIVSQKDLTWSKTTYEVVLDGKAVEGNVLDSIYDYKDPAEDGSYKSILRLAVGTPTEGKHTVKVTVKYDGTVLYQTEAFEVVYVASSTGTVGKPTGDNNGNNGNNGNSGNNGTTKPTTTPSTGDAVVYATIAMAVALVAMVVVVKKSRA